MGNTRPAPWPWAAPHGFFHSLPRYIQHPRVLVLLPPRLPLSQALEQAGHAASGKEFGEGNGADSGEGQGVKRCRLAQ